MSGLLEELKTDFATNDKEYRHAYADESLNTFIATQIKVLREQRELTQQELAVVADMKQSMISRYENSNYSSWSVSTLKKLAEAFDVCLDVKFRSFGELVKSVDGFSRESLQVPKFADDPFFKESPAIATATGVASGNVASLLGTWPSTNEFAECTVGFIGSATMQYPTLLGGANEWWNQWSRPVVTGISPENSLFLSVAQDPAGSSILIAQPYQEQTQAA
jgi:transcriptional regulator with XRE-family HTH domain